MILIITVGCVTWIADSKLHELIPHDLIYYMITYKIQDTRIMRYI